MKRTASQIGRSNVQTSKSHERRVANLLTTWSGSEFRRRRNEGRGRDTIARDLTGDVIPVERPCLFNIECKKQVGFSLDALFSNPAGCLFSQWWHQSNYDAMLCTKHHERKFFPMLFFKPVPAWDWVAISTMTIPLLYAPGAVDGPGCTELWFPHLRFDHYAECGEITHNVSHTKKDKNKVMVPLELDSCFICRWKTFAENVDPDSFFVSSGHGVLPGSG